MTHRIEKLRETLRDLEAELDQVDTLDPQSRELLVSAAAEIHQALAKGEKHDEAIEHQSFTDRLMSATQSFEDSHPTLSRLVGNVVNALAQLGI
jgi:ABC-type transporter Mla subunit MlaD